MNPVDICVVGGGPAGMTAATTAARNGLSVILLDERPSAGGQIYRGLVEGPFKDSSHLGPDYSRGHEILTDFDAVYVERHFGATVWRVDLGSDHGFVSFSTDGASYRRQFKKLVLATGAIERPFAFEGWTLLGVMNAGAGQLLLKSSAIVPTGNIVLAGNGPLLLLFASQLLSLGVRPTAILDTAPRTNKYAAAIRSVRGLVANRDKILKGLSLIRDIRQADVPIYRDVSVIKAVGADCIKSVEFTCRKGRKTLNADALLVHEGVIPNTQITRALGCSHVWDDRQHCYCPLLDSFGETTVPGVFVVGDGMSINGALAAPASAQVAVVRILEQNNRLSPALRDMQAQAFVTLRREQSFRPFLDTLYPPRLARLSPSGETIVCRCENVRASDLRAAVRDGAVGPAQAKAFTRCGMGPCQGRICGPIVSQLIATETGRRPQDVGSYNVRFPLKPVTVAEMATCNSSPEGEADHAA